MVPKVVSGAGAGARVDGSKPGIEGFFEAVFGKGSKVRISSPYIYMYIYMYVCMYVCMYMYMYMYMARAARSFCLLCLLPLYNSKMYDVYMIDSGLA
jgi:hypothetical protein